MSNKVFAIEMLIFIEVWMVVGVLVNGIPTRMSFFGAAFCAGLIAVGRYLFARPNETGGK